MPRLLPRRAPGLLLALGLAVLTVLPGPGLAGQAPTPPQAKPGWFDRQLAKFQGYPHLDMAYRLAREGKTDEAVREYERYLAIKPDDARARADYLQLLAGLGRKEQALDQARRILAARPDDPELLLAVGQALGRVGGTDQALSTLQRAVALSQNDPARHRRAILATVDLLGRLDRVPDALALLDTLPAAPADYATLTARGQLLAKAEDNARARDAFAAALDAAGAPRDKRDALASLALTRAALGELDAARADLAKARDLAPDDDGLLRQSAVLAAKAGDLKEAARLGDALVQRAPDPDNREFLANILAELGHRQAAIDTLLPLRQERLNPGQALRRDMHLGLLYLETDQAEAAVAVLRDAAAIGRDPLALVRLSRALERTGQTEEAAAILKEAAARSFDPETMVELATLERKLDRNAAALQTLDQALSRAPSPEARARALAMKATLLDENGDDDAAAQALTQALATPGADKARLLPSLGQIRLRQGDAKAAVAAFTEAVAAGAGEGAEQSLAEALVRDGQVARALDLYRTLAERIDDPARKADYRLASANLLSRLGRQAQAAALFEELAAAGRPELWQKAGQSHAAAREPGPAEAAFAKAAQTATTPTDKAAALIALGNLHASQRQPAKAYAAFSQAAALAEALPHDQRAAIALGRGLAALLSGQAAKAVESLDQALGLAMDGARRGKILLALAQAYVSLGDDQKARDAWTRAAITPGAERADRVAANESLGNALAAAGDLAGAELALRRALAVSGDSWRIQAALGRIAFAAGRYEQALDSFTRSLARHPDVEIRLAVGRCYEKLGKPGLALLALGQAAPDVAGLPRDQQREYHLALGFLHAAEFRNEAAVADFKAALALGEDPENAVRLGRLERLAGQPEAARQRLEAVDQGRLPPDLRLLRLSELASLAEAAKDYDAARQYLETALAQAPDPDIAFRLGNVLRDSHHPREAVDAYRQAVAQNDANRYLTALGYALGATRQYAEAARTFETVLARDQDYLPLWEDLGYAYMHECDNARSVDRFERAIDNAPLRPVDSPADQEKLEADVHRLRKEVTKLETRFTTTAYASYIAGEAGPQPGSGGTSANTIRSGVGAEFAWIPPVIGFRDDRILQVIGRFGANFDRDTLNVDDTTWQGAVGLRYKPFKSQNLNLGFERLFKIGRAAEDNWLLRGMYALTDGYDVKPKERFWNYSFLYAEADYYLEHDRRAMFYAEGRQGITCNLRDRFLITPHLVADVRVWTPDADDTSYVEGGAGVSLKYLFNRADYEVERSSVEFLLQYKYGTFFNKTKVRDRENVINALYLTSIVKF